MKSTQQIKNEIENRIKILDDHIDRIRNLADTIDSYRRVFEANRSIKSELIQLLNWIDN